MARWPEMRWATPAQVTQWSEWKRKFLESGGSTATGRARFLDVRRRLIKGRINHDYKTWDCGYQAPTSRMQYTATSFADPIVGLFSRFYVLRDVRQPVEGLFPRHASFGSMIHDWLEKKVLDPILGLIRNVFGWLQLFQSGQMQQYILFGLILLMIVIIWIIGAL